MAELGSMKLGAYLLEEKISSGGTAEIFLAHDRSQFEKKFAIKKLRKEFSHDRDFINLLHKEYETLQHLNHPNIIRAYDWFSGGENHFVVLEWVEGSSLRMLLDRAAKERSHLHLPQVLDFGIQIADALDYIHQVSDEQGITLGLLHSDLNPRNILISNSGQVKLIDLSFPESAVNAQGNTEEKRRGVILYMSPEQANREPMDVRSDIFSLGILLYEMLLGTEPFPGKTTLEVYGNLMTREILPENLPRDLPEKMKKLLCRALRKKREERFGTMAEFKVALEKVFLG